MPLFETLLVDATAVAALVEQHWGLTLGAQLKASQNTTYAATDASGAHFAVRATADPSGAKHARITDELQLVAHLARSVPAVCAPVPPRGADGDSSLAVHVGGVTVCVVRWARGEAVDFAAYRWMTDATVIAAWGSCFAQLHRAARDFAQHAPQVAARVQRWDDLHGGLMAGVAVAPEDAAAASDPRCFGLLHGDLNVSNFCLEEAGGGAPPQLSVFDFDQACRGWWEYDLAQAALTSLMLAEGGSLPAGDPVPQAQPDAFLDALVDGYERVAGPGAVDRPRLARMLKLRKLSCAKFCAQAAAEGSAPPEMAWFIDYINRWMARAPPQ